MALSLNPIIVNSTALGLGLGQYIANFANPDVTWEHQVSSNLGIDIGIARQWDITVDLYNKVSDKFLFGATYPAITGTGIPNSGTLGMAAPVCELW